jgi:oxygen-independent coproporphyrinogen-3 oxidase
MRLMCDRRLDFSGLSRETGVDFASTYAKELAGLDDLKTDGLLRAVPGGLEVTATGIPLLRVIAMRFDGTLAPGAMQHSRTI